ncbi:MAG: efflux RND transporter periplasmic adaptor subunit [Xanthobacteraceae bacterium]|nr:efflux RND transporter periplasmic adaptor subunit [Xanthobacteraceae bacterium]
MRVQIKLVVLLSLLLLAPTLSFGAKKPRPPAVPGGAPVTVSKATKACFTDTLAMTGVLQPRSLVQVRPEQEGLQIVQVKVEAGDTVTAGQALAQLARPEGQPAATATVTAPVAGTVLHRSAIIGTTASARAQPLFEIIPKGELEVSAEVSARDLARVAPGQKAKVKIIGAGEYPGSVRLVSPAVDPATQQGEVRVFVGADPALRTGAFARAIVTLGENCAVAIPLSAILYGDEGAVVQVVREDHVETRTVETGLASDGQVQIGKGLADGDLVVLRAGAFLRDGDPVRPIPAGEATAVK